MNVINKRRIPAISKNRNASRSFTNCLSNFSRKHIDLPISIYRIEQRQYWIIITATQDFYLFTFY